MTVHRLRAAARPLAAAAILAVFVISLGRVYTRHRQVADALESLRGIGALQDVHKRLYGEYTEDLSRLADLTDDWRGFMASLDALLDFRAGFEMRVTKDGYRIEAHARDRRRTPVVWEGPAKRPLAALPASKGPGS